MTLYDALFLYGLALRDAYEETKNASVYMDGKLIWSKMTARQFIGIDWLYPHYLGQKFEGELSKISSLVRVEPLKHLSSVKGAIQILGYYVERRVSSLYKKLIMLVHF